MLSVESRSTISYDVAFYFFLRAWETVYRVCFVDAMVLYLSRTQGLYMLHLTQLQLSPSMLLYFLLRVPPLRIITNTPHHKMRKNWGFAPVLVCHRPSRIRTGLLSTNTPTSVQRISSMQPVHHGPVISMVCSSPLIL